jgi:UDP-glucose 4-epimerase
MKVVVTGGAGQLGSVVLERLVSSRKVKRIVTLDLRAPRVTSPKLEYRIADMRDPGLERHLEGAEALVHLAFVHASKKGAVAARSTNVEGTRRVLDAVLQHDVATVVVASSVAVYGLVEGHPDPIVEETPRRGPEADGDSDDEQAVEAMLDAFEAEHPRVRVVRLRPGILFGRRMGQLPERLLRRGLLPLAGESPLPVVWDEDVAEAVLLALASEARGAFNLVAADPLPGDELARLAALRPLRLSAENAARLFRVSGAVGAVAPVPAWIRLGQVRLVVSSARAKEQLGWSPRYPTSAEVAMALGKLATRRADRRIRLFLAMVPRVARRARHAAEIPVEGRMLKLVIHLDLTGPRGGDYTLALDEGLVAVKRGIPRPPDAVVTVSAEAFLGMLAGRLNPSTAVLTGQIRVRGEPIAGMVLAGLVGGFRRATELPGLRGRMARGMSRWMEKG